MSAISRLRQGCAALLAAATLCGCPLAADDAYEFVEDGGTVSGDVVVPCGVAPPPRGGPCPATCSGGCRGLTCRIVCFGDQRCKEATLACPPGFACDVVCMGTQACEKASITCPERYACSFGCDGIDACKDAKLHCADGNCQITCGLNDACENTDFQCGVGACSVICAGSAPSVRNCADACSCTAC